MTSDLFPMLTSPITEWQAYVEAHPPYPLIADHYPHVDGDQLAVDLEGCLPRTSVVGETSLWGKVSA